MSYDNPMNHWTQSLSTEALLKLLPTDSDDSISEATWFVDCYVFRGRTLDDVRLILGEVCLEVHKADIEQVEYDLAHSDRAAAVPARVALRRGAVLLNVEPSKPYWNHIFGVQRPFAISARTVQEHVEVSERFNRLQNEFLAQRGLIDDVPHDPNLL